MVMKLNNHFVPRKNKHHARFRLQQNQQKSHQTIMQFYLECRELVRDCQYRNMVDELLLDHHLIFEIKNDRLREKAIEKEWNLQRFLEVESRQLASSRQADEISVSINIKKEPEDDERIRKIKYKNPKTMQDAQESACDRCGIKHQPGY